MQSPLRLSPQQRHAPSVANAPLYVPSSYDWYHEDASYGHGTPFWIEETRALWRSVDGANFLG